MESRIIREHRVYGKVVYVEAESEEKARTLSLKAAFPTKSRDASVWEAKEIKPGLWEMFVARHGYAFALND